MAEWIKNKTQLCAVYNKLTLDLQTNIGLKWKGGRKYFMRMITEGEQEWLCFYQTKCTWSQKLSQETKKKALCNNKSVNIKKVVTITNIYAHNFRTPKHIKKTLTERSGKIDTNKIILEDFNIPLSIMYTTTRQNINKKIVDLNNTTNQIDLIDMYKTVHTTA